MSPQNKKKLYLIRKKLDFLDNKFLNLIKIRTSLINEVINIKQNKIEIIDHRRIKQVLKNIKNKSKKKNIDTILTLRIWKNMIWSYIDYEKRKFKKK